MQQQLGFYYYYMNPVVCPHCGARNPADTKTCNFCNREVTEKNNEAKNEEPKEEKKGKKRSKWRK